MKHKQLVLKHLKEWNQQIKEETTDLEFTIVSFVRASLREGCSTACCAIGYLATRSDFTDLGFCLGNFMTPAYNNYSDESAIATFLSLL